VGPSTTYPARTPSTTPTLSPPSNTPTVYLSRSVRVCVFPLCSTCRLVFCLSSPFFHTDFCAKFRSNIQLCHKHNYHHHPHFRLVRRVSRHPYNQHRLDVDDGRSSNIIKAHRLYNLQGQAQSRQLNSFFAF